MLPVNARHSRIIDGVIVPPTHLELIAVDHCNITCAGCNHASPVMPAWFADPDAVHRDFSILARHYRPRFIKVIGGEPLMHKNLPALIDAIRASGMTCRIVLVTNGTLLPKTSEAVWRSVDEIELSVYPGIPGIEEIVCLAHDRMAEMGKTLTVFRFQSFRATFTTRGTADQALIRKIYSACKVANYWGCHGIRDGYFYKCPQSMYVGRLTNGIAESDRIAVTDRPGLQQELLSFVNSPEPLAACTHCLGTVGIQEPHSLPPRARWRDPVDRPTEELLDADWLEQSLVRFDEPDDCKVIQSPLGLNLLRRWPRLRQLTRTLLSGRRESGVNERRRNVILLRKDQG